jgi:hypothetical protein
MDIEMSRDGGLDFVEKLAKLRGAVAGMAFAVTLPIAISRAAKSEFVPWRL